MNFAEKVAEIVQSRRIHPQTPPEDLPLSESFASLRLFDLNHRAVPLLLHGTHTVASRLPVSAPGDRNRTDRLFMLDFIRGFFHLQGVRAICNTAVTKSAYDFRFSGHKARTILYITRFVARKRATTGKNTKTGPNQAGFHNTKARAAWVSSSHEALSFPRSAPPPARPRRLWDGSGWW